MLDSSSPADLSAHNQTQRIKRSVSLLKEIREAVTARRDGLGPDLETTVAQIVTLYAADSIGSDIDRALQMEGV